MKNKIVVAIDGFSSCGKSTIAKQLARDTGYLYVDTGAMYRAVALFALSNGMITKGEVDKEKLREALGDAIISFGIVGGNQHTFLNGKDVEREIRSLEIGNLASKVSSIGFVRKELVRQQQLLGQSKGVVMDGRDIGTVVFPDAELKVFITADPDVRAKRRYEELLSKNMEVDYNSVLENIIERDKRDTNRAESPLRRAEDAKLLDNSSFDITLQQQVIMNWFQEALKKANIHS